MTDAYADQPFPWDHQGEAVSLQLMGSSALWYDPRVGKTRPTNESLRILDAEGKIDRAVILGPIDAKEVWRRHLPIFMPHWGVEVLKGLQPHALAAGTRAVVLNPDILDVTERRGTVYRGWLGTLGRWMGEGRAVLVMDECHEYATNPRAKEYKAVRQLALVAERVWQLTGTFYERSALDAHHQLQLLGPRYPFLHRPDQWFGDRFCEKKHNPFRGALRNGTRRDGTPYQYRAGGTDYSGIAEGAEDRLVRELEGLVIRRTAEDVGLNKPRLLPVWVDHYDQTVFLRRDEMERLRSELVLLKAQRAIEYVGKLKERPVIVYGWHRKLLQHLADHWKAPLIYGDTSQAERVRLQDQFQAGEVPIMVCTLGMRAVDLARANHVVYAEIDWSATKMRQSMDRIVNANKPRESVAHILLVSGSVEEEVWDRILMKGAAIERLDLAARRLRELGLDMAELSS
jgi:Helicase conserved C-terminal domain